MSPEKHDEQEIGTLRSTLASFLPDKEAEAIIYNQVHELITRLKSGVFNPREIERLLKEVNNWKKADPQLSLAEELVEAEADPVAQARGWWTMYEGTGLKQYRDKFLRLFPTWDMMYGSLKKPYEFMELLWNLYWDKGHGFFDKEVIKMRAPLKQLIYTFIEQAEKKYGKPDERRLECWRFDIIRYSWYFRDFESRLKACNNASDFEETAKDLSHTFPDSFGLKVIFSYASVAQCLDRLSRIIAGDKAPWIDCAQKLLDRFWVFTECKEPYVAGCIQLADWGGSSVREKLKNQLGVIAQSSVHDAALGYAMLAHNTGGQEEFTNALSLLENIGFDQDFPYKPARTEEYIWTLLKKANRMRQEELVKMIKPEKLRFSLNLGLLLLQMGESSAFCFCPELAFITAGVPLHLRYYYLLRAVEISNDRGRTLEEIWRYVQQARPDDLDLLVRIWRTKQRVS